jgi:hypothetical protein
VKHNDELIQSQMQTFQSSLGSLPPGAKGTVGAGRGEHSTNLKTNQPASYSYANFTTMGGPDIINDMTPPPPKKKAKTSAATVHGNHMAQLKELGASLSTGMEKLMGNHDKESKLYERQAALEKSILFYQKFPDNEKMQKKMEEAIEAHMAITNEITALTTK